MESYTEARSALAVAERASAAPYIDYPPTPKWYPPAVGAWAALMLLAVHGAADRPAVFIPLLVVLVAAEGAFIGWYRRYRQTMPTLRGAPPEINAAFRRYLGGIFVVVFVVVFVAASLGALVAAPVAFVLVTVGLAVYERSYANAAEATRRRLARTA